MAVIHQITVASPNLAPGSIGPIREAFAAAFWRWYEAHREDKIKTIKIWIFSKTVRVQDLRQVFEMLFGPQPTA